MAIDPQQAQAVFLEVASLAASERSAALDRLCGTNDPLRKRVLALLAAHERADPLPTLPEAATKAAAPAGHRMLDGRYKLIELIGEGGMGAVWLAEQLAPVRRRVAVKLIKPGMDSRQVLARFEAERQALAMMEHPNIAKVLDGGEAPDGRPYFVMELVKGVPITEYCDQQRLPVHVRLELFAQVCHAVQHAHQKGVIHRDLKPSNVLVGLYDGRAVPKVIDFGLAKAIHQPLIDQSLNTGHGMLVGTPLYMSPEQAELNNLDIDTRSDIYSLGVILYELLTGTTPLERQRLREAAWEEMVRLIKEVEPPKPSTKISSAQSLPSVAAQRGVPPTHLKRLMRGELDWIVMKAIEKERSRRYESASAFARDVQRYLHDEPVEASPPSTAYRIRKFVRKHRLPLGAAALLLLVLLAGICGTTWGMLEAQRQERHAFEETKKKQRALDLAERRRREAVAAQEEAVRSEQEAMEALRSTTDDVVEKLLSGRPQLGPGEREFLEAALTRWQAFARRRPTGELGPALQAEGAYRVATLRNALGERVAAEAGFREVVRLTRDLAATSPAADVYAALQASAHNELGTLLIAQSQYSEAIEEYRAAQHISRSLAKKHPANETYQACLASSHANLGGFLLMRGEVDSAIVELRSARHVQQELVKSHPNEVAYAQDLASTCTNLGNALQLAGELREASAVYQAATSLRKEMLQRTPQDRTLRHKLALSLNQWGTLQRELNDRRGAEASYQEAVELLTPLVREFGAAPEFRFELAKVQANLASHYGLERKWDPAIRAANEAAELFEALVNDFPEAFDYQPALALFHNNIARLHATRGYPMLAEPAYRRAIELHEQLLARAPNVPGYRVELARTRANLGELQTNFGDLAEAEAMLTTAHEEYRKLMEEFPAQPEFREGAVRVRQLLASLALAQADWEAAQRGYEQSRELLAPLAERQPRSPSVRQQQLAIHNGLASAAEGRGAHAAAVEHWEAALSLAADVERSLYVCLLARCLARAGQTEPALQAARELAPREKNGYRLFVLAGVFGAAHAVDKKPEYEQRALELLRAAAASGIRSSERETHDDFASLTDRAAVERVRAEIVWNRGQYFAQVGKWSRAAEVWKTLDQLNDYQVLTMATVLLGAGEKERHRQRIDTALARWSDSPHRVVNERIAKAGLLADVATEPERLQELVRFAERAVEGAEADPNYHWFCFVRVLAALRQQDWDAVRQWRQRGSEANQSRGRLPQLDAPLAMTEAIALAKQGDRAAARTAYTEGVKVASRWEPEAPGRLRGAVADWLTFELLRREAAAAVEQ